MADKGHYISMPAPHLDSLLQLTERLFTQNNLAAAEVVCRDILDEDPGNQKARDILDKIFDAVGARGPMPAKPAGPRYLLLKSWGYGFWSDVASVVGGLLLAEATQRIPVVHWGSNSLFGDGSGRDAFRHFFLPVSEPTIEDLAQLPDLRYYPPKWRRANLAEEDLDKWSGSYARLAPLFYVARTEEVAVCDFYVGVADVMPWLSQDHPLYGKPAIEAYRWLIQKYLKPHPEITARCEEFVARHMSGRPFVAAHVRGSDKVVETGNLNEINQSYFRVLERIDPQYLIFLLTDDSKWLKLFTQRFGDRIVATECRRSDSAFGVHHLQVEDRVEMGREVVVDAYIALRADRFIGNGESNVSAMISLMREWPAGTCLLNCLPRLLRRDYHRYVIPKQPRLSPSS